MNARAVIEAETPKQFIKRAIGLRLPGWLNQHGYELYTTPGHSTEVRNKVFNDPAGWHAYVDVTLWGGLPDIVQVAVGIKNGETFYKERWARAQEQTDQSAIKLVSFIDEVVAKHAPRLIDGPRSERANVADIFLFALKRLHAAVSDTD
jgi:hypothetical protein